MANITIGILGNTYAGNIAVSANADASLKNWCYQFDGGSWIYIWSGQTGTGGNFWITNYTSGTHHIQVSAQDPSTGTWYYSAVATVDNYGLIPVISNFTLDVIDYDDSKIVIYARSDQPAQKWSYLNSSDEWVNVSSTSRTFDRTITAKVKGGSNAVQLAVQGGSGKWGYTEVKTISLKTPTINSVKVVPQTSTTVKVTVSANRKCNYWQYSLNDGSSWRDLSNAVGTSITATITVSAGTHSIIVRGRDSDSSNWGKSSAVTFDTALPTITNNSVINARDSSLTVSASSNVKCNIWQYRIKKSTDASYSEWKNFSTKEGTSASASITVGHYIYNVEVRARKSVNLLYGYGSSAKTLNFLAPEVDASHLIVTSVTETKTTIKMDARASVACQSWQYKLNSGEWKNFTAPDAGAYDSITVDNANNKIQLRATRTSNGVVGYSSTVVFDTSMPTITQSCTVASATQIAISAKASATCDVWQYQIDDGTWETIPNVSGSSITATVSATTGTRKIRIRAKKASVNYNAYGYGTAQTVDIAEPQIQATYKSETANTVKVTATADATCDIWQYSLNNGEWETFEKIVGKSVSATIFVTSSTETIKIRARKESNKLYGESASQSFDFAPAVLYVYGYPYQLKFYAELTTDVFCNLWQYRYDGGEWKNISTDNTKEIDWQFQLTEGTHTIQFRVRKTSNLIFTESAVMDASTLIPSVTIGNITYNSETSIDVTAETDIIAHDFQYSIDGGDWVEFSGAIGGTSKTETIEITSQIHTIQLRASVQDNEIYGYSEEQTIDPILPIVSVSVSEESYDSLKITVNSNVNCNQWEYNNGEEWQTFSVIDSTSQSVRIIALDKDTEYNVLVRAKRSSNGLYGTANLNVKTLGGYIRINQNGEWHEMIPYVMLDGEWVESIAMTKVGNTWRVNA